MTGWGGRIPWSRSETPQFEIYSCCDDLPFYNWVKLNVSKDLKWLVKSGNPPQDILTDTWNNLYEEYSGLVEDADSQHLETLKKDIDITSNKILIVSAILDQLQDYRDEELIELLRNKFGFRFSYEDLNKDLNRTRTLLKTDEMWLLKNQAEYKKLNNAGAHEANEKDFNQQLAVLSKFQGYQINSRKISVSEYVTLLNMFKDYVKSQANGQ